MAILGNWAKLSDEQLDEIEVTAIRSGDRKKLEILKVERARRERQRAGGAIRELPEVPAKRPFFETAVGFATIAAAILAAIALLMAIF